jgi:hypothetical protein
MARVISKFKGKAGKLYYVKGKGATKTLMETTRKNASPKRKKAKRKGKKAHSWPGQPRRHAKAAKKGHRKAKRSKKSRSPKKSKVLSYKAALRRTKKR